MIKNIYIYLVLFATLMMIIGGSVGAFIAVADIVAPEPYYQTFEEYQSRYIDRPSVEGENREIRSEEEIRKEYEAAVIMHQERQIERAKNSLIKSLGWIFIPLIVFVVFQRRLAIEKAKNNAGS